MFSIQMWIFLTEVERCLRSSCFISHGLEYSIRLQLWQWNLPKRRVHIKSLLAKSYIVYLWQVCPMWVCCYWVCYFYRRISFSTTQICNFSLTFFSSKYWLNTACDTLYVIELQPSFWPRFRHCVWNRIKDNLRVYTDCFPNWILIRRANQSL